MENFLKNKSVVVAGGSSGMGLALARKAAAAGASLHIIGRSEEKLAVAKAVLGAAFTGHIADIAVESEVASVASQFQMSTTSSSQLRTLCLSLFHRLATRKSRRCWAQSFGAPFTSCAIFKAV